MFIYLYENDGIKEKKKLWHEHKQSVQMRLIVPIVDEWQLLPPVLSFGRIYLKGAQA
jgi:hypothetical protein